MAEPWRLRGFYQEKNSAPPPDLDIQILAEALKGREIIKPKRYLLEGCLPHFDTEDAVDRVLHKNFHELNNKLVEVKPALPKEANPGSGGGGRGGGHQPYGSSGANASTFDARMDGGRFMQPQTAGGGAYAPYPTYGGPNYGYGAANSTVGYGGYGGYGAGGYGSANIGFTGPAGAYGNPSAANAGYVRGPAGALKGPWSNQAPGYGASGYNANAGYAPGIVGAVSAPMVPSPGGNLQQRSGGRPRQGCRPPVRRRTPRT